MLLRFGRRLIDEIASSWSTLIESSSLVHLVTNGAQLAIIASAGFKSLGRPKRRGGDED